MPNKFVLIGGAGFIGFHIAKALSDRNFDVVIVDNFSNSEADSLFMELIRRKNITFYRESHNSDSWKHHVKDSVIINLAARNGTNKFYSHPFDVLHDCSEAGLEVPHYAAILGAHSYYYFGSSESYSGSINIKVAPIPTPENVPLIVEEISNPRWSYAAAKILGEVAAMSAQSQFGLPSCVLRIHNVYGPRMGFDHVIPDLFRKFDQGIFDVINCSHTRAFLFIDDAVDQIIRLLKMDVANSSTSVVNIGTQNEISILNLARLILSSMKINGKINCVSDHKGSVSRRVPDVSVLRALVGSHFETSLDKGIEITYRYYRNKVFS